MSWRKSLARLLIFAVLEIGAVCGVPITPEQIEKLLNLMTRTKIVRVIKIDGK